LKSGLFFKHAVYKVLWVENGIDMLSRNVGTLLTTCAS